MARIYYNNAASTLASGIAAGATTLPLADGSGFGPIDTGAGEYIVVTLYKRSTQEYELVKCDAISGNNLTVATSGRGFDGTTAIAFDAGDKASIRITASTLNDVALNSDNLSGLVTPATARTNLGIVPGDGTGEFVTGDVLKGTSRQFTTQQSIATETVAYAASLSWDMQASPVAEVTLTGSVTTLTPSNFENGGWYTLRLVQGGSGSYTVSWPASFDWGTAGAPALSTAVGSMDIITIHATASKLMAGWAVGFTA